MCQLCIDACKRLYPTIDDAAVGDFLMMTTPFPFGTPEDTERALILIHAQTDGTVAGAMAFADEEMACDLTEFIQ